MFYVSLFQNGQKFKMGKGQNWRKWQISICDFERARKLGCWGLLSNETFDFSNLKGAQIGNIWLGKRALIHTLLKS